MPTFKLPLSGDVVQSISPWTAFMSPIGSQLGLINISLGQSGEPTVEEEVLSDVASYGKQLGRIGDALIVLLAHFHPTTPLSQADTDAIDQLKEMLVKIADVKEKHKRPALRPRAAVAPKPSPAPAPPLPGPAESLPSPGVAAASSSPKPASSPPSPEPAPSRPSPPTPRPPSGRPTRRPGEGA
jgi:hypothetical protein